jgi:hypothetical protein
MLSAIIVIGVCVIVLVAVYGLIAIVLMLLNRIQMLFKAFRECGFTLGGAREGFRDIVADAKTRPANFLLGVAIFCVFAFFAEYILLGLFALGALATLLSKIGKWRGSGIEERLTRHLSRPRIVDESHQAICDGAKASADSVGRPRYDHGPAARRAAGRIAGARSAL